MKIGTLRLVLAIQACAAAGAIILGLRLLDWRDAPSDLIKDSPDAAHTIQTLLLEWGVCIGICVGIFLCLVAIAIEQRKALIDAPFALKAQWFAAVIPVLCLAWFGEHFMK